MQNEYSSEILQTLKRIEGLLSEKKSQCTPISTTGSGTIKPGPASVSIISSGTAATITVNGVVLTTVANRSYTFGVAGKVIDYDIEYAGGGDTLQILIEY